jgi:endonuclease G
MIPQTHTLNAGIWKTLEVQTRAWALQQDSIHVWAGAVGDKGKIGRITVPTKCWKVVYVKKSKEWMAFLFENDKSKPGSLNEVKVDVADVEKLTGFKFNK